MLLEEQYTLYKILYKDYEYFEGDDDNDDYYNKEKNYYKILVIPEYPYKYEYDDDGDEVYDYTDEIDD